MMKNPPLEQKKKTHRNRSQIDKIAIKMVFMTKEKSILIKINTNELHLN